MSRKKLAINLDVGALMSDVENCRLCERMNESARIFSHASGSIEPDALFIGEAPGRLGADLSAIPFHGDVAGHNFENLLDRAFIDRGSIFVTNAVLCNPRDSVGNNATPSAVEIRNCNAFLKRQIDALNPPVVVTLGANALRAVSLIGEHGSNLKGGVGTAISWYGRTLVPLYHPGQRAMIHRDFEAQLRDYRFVAGLLPKRTPSDTRMDAYVVAQAILDSAARPLSYFALHKLFYLTEVIATGTLGQRLTRAYIIRQADGPYVTDLHINKLTKRLSGLCVTRRNDSLYLSLRESNSKINLFDSPVQSASDKCSEIVRLVLARHLGKTDAELKTAAYLTQPMRRILSAERQSGRVLNSPIKF
jgi:uracil-DNA glycosylase family 4